MTALEARIAEVIAGHWSASTHTDCEPFVDKCDGCGEVVRTWGERHGTWVDSPLVTHQAAMLAPVIAAVWDEGSESVTLATNAYGGWVEYIDNPYRADNLEAS